MSVLAAVICWALFMATAYEIRMWRKRERGETTRRPLEEFRRDARPRDKW